MVFDIIDNLPIKIKTYLLNHKQRLIIENRKEIRFFNTDGRYWKSFPTPVKNDLADFLRKELINYTIDCFHCTRLKNKSAVLTDGLRVLQVDLLSIEILNVLKEYLPEDTIDIARDCFQNYKYEEKIGVRENMVWFIGNERLSKSKGCHDFFRYFGGEITRRVLEPHKEIFYPILEKIGSPYLIHCEIPLAELTESYHYENLVNMILYSLNKRNGNIDFEFYLKKDITANMIKKVISVQ